MLTRRLIALCVAPLVLLLGALGVLSQAEPAYERYLEYRKFWGGNPSEVYSHWLDMVIMSGNALALAWLLALEAYVRSRQSLQRPPRTISATRVVCVVLSGVIATILDLQRGEGTVLIAYPIFFLPLLAASYYLLRQFAAWAGWRFGSVLAFSAAYSLLHVAAQLYYEPSDTGGPNDRIVPIWLLTVGVALLWALVQGVRTRRLLRFFTAFGRTIRKPRVWGPTVIVASFLAIAATTRANRLHTPRNQFAMSWLNELETKLTDSVVAQLRREHVTPNLREHSKIAPSDQATSIFDDARINGGTSLRIFIPVTETNYLFLWGDAAFTYCDLRSLENQIDQDFIETLLARGGTHETGFYTVLWSTYRAGRVLKEANGKVRAICVIKSE